MRGAALALTLFFFTYSIQGQHIGPATTVVDGSKHPELIPDATAYRLYFLTVANMTPHLRDAQLAMAGLSTSEVVLATKTLEDFKRSYDLLSEEYNRSVSDSERSGVTPDSHAFVQKRDALVERTRASLLSALSEEGSNKLSSHVEHEKRQMKVSNE